MSEMNESQHRALETALGEVLGGQRPPDLSGRILDALRQEPGAVIRGEAALKGTGGDAAKKGAPAVIRSVRPTRDFWRGAAAAAVLVGAPLAIFRWPAAGAPLSLRVAVVEGEMGWRTSAGSTLHVETGGVVTMPLLCGDRIRSGVSAATVLSLSSPGDAPSSPPAGVTLTAPVADGSATGDAGAARGRVAMVFEPIGTLRMARDSEIEVRDMDWKQFGGGFAVGGITVAVIAGSIRWFSGDMSLEGRRGDMVPLQRGATAAGASVAMTEREQRLAEDLEHATARIRDLEGAASRRAVRPPVEQSDTAAPATRSGTDQKPPIEAVFLADGMEDALKAIDWDKMGDATNQLMPLLEQMMAVIDTADQAKLIEIAGKISVANGALVAQAAEMIKHNVPGSGPNGAFSHPMVVANHLNALFAKAGIPLSDEQRATLDAVARRFTTEDAARRAGYSPETLALKKVIDEMEMKDRFYGQTRGALDDKQRGMITSEATQGWTSVDVFSSGIAWAQFARPVQADDQAGLVRNVTERVVKDLGLDAGLDGGKVEAAVNAWARSFPDDFWKQSLPDNAKYGMQRLDRVRAAAAAQLRLMESLRNSIQLNPQQRTRLLDSKGVYVPYVGR